MIYYRYLFKNMEELSPNEGLVYSALLSHSLMSIEHFEIDGTFNIEYAKVFIRENADRYGIECLDYNPISTRRLAKHLNMKEDTVRKIKNDLKNRYYLIGSDIIKCPIELLDSGYIDIPSDTKLKGRQLTFYGLLRDRSTRFNGIIDTWASRLAEIAGITKGNAYRMLAELEKKGYVERQITGKLKIK